MENNEIIYGKNPVESVLEDNPSRINKIYIAIGIKYDQKMKNIITICKQHKITYQEIPRDKMDRLTGGVHQGVAASISPVEYVELQDLLDSLKDKEDILLVILDRVEDPHNLGSVIRTAAAAGVDGVIIPKRRSSQLTSTVFKASAGTLEKMPIVQVGNLSNTIEKLKKMNIWVIAAEGDADGYYFQTDYNMNCALVLGGEHQGVSSLVKKNCDTLVKIPMKNNVNSLNVANAASILIYEIVRQRILKK